MIEVIDNFIDDEYFGSIQDTIAGTYQQWFYQPDIVGPKFGKGELGKHGFNCWIVEQPNTFVDNYSAGLLTNLITKMMKHCGAETIIRSRLDMTLYCPSNNKCPAHIDQPTPHFATIFYLNDSDGNTVIYNEKYDDSIGIPEKLTVQQEIEPRANRLLIFDGLYIHTGHTPSEHNNRIILNSNLN